MLIKAAERLSILVLWLSCVHTAGPAACHVHTCLCCMSPAVTLRYYIEVVYEVDQVSGDFWQRQRSGYLLQVQQ
jgi:hypothetical protein